MTVALLAAAIFTNAAIAEDVPAPVDRSISQPQALQLVRDLFSRFCQTSRNFDCAIGTQAPIATRSLGK